MAVSWPPSLPQGDAAQGYDTIEEAEDRLLFKDTTSGPGKLRPKYTSGPARVSMPMILTKAQLTTLMDFYHDTLKGGSLPFEWVHVRTGADQLFRFQPGVVPTAQMILADRYRVTLALEMIPGFGT